MKIKKIAISISFIMSLGANSTNYNVLVNNNDYEIKEELDRVIYTEWENIGNEYDCINNFETDDFYLNDPFTQIIYCSQDQSRTKTVYKGTTIISETTENQTLNTEKSQNVYGTLLLENCTRILEKGFSKGDGEYKITTSKGSIDVLCDMNIDGGGWTLVTYAGKTINNSKLQTAGSGVMSLWNPLMFSWGDMRTDSLVDKVSFSRFDYFNDIVKPEDEFLSKRTSVPEKMIIFPVVNTDWFGRNFSEGHFTITSSNKYIPYLKLTKSGDKGWKTETSNVEWSYVDSTSGNHPGINWNVPLNENCDQCGNSFETSLNHRSILYWESYPEDDAHTPYNQYWWHGSPLTLEDGIQAKNTTDDVEFWYREK